MPNTSFVQTDFRGGKWSPSAQGKMHDPHYKFAMNICNNGMPLFNGPWTRRPGFIWGGNTRQGKIARLIDCFLKFSEPFQLEFTDSFMRAHAGIGNVLTPDSTGVTIASISTAKPAVVTVNGTLPSGWSNFDTVMLNLTAPSTSPILAGRQFQIQSISSNTFAIFDAMTGLPIDGSIQPYTAPVIRGQDRVLKILELTTPWTAAMLFDLRMVQTDSTAVIFHTRTQPQSLTVPPIGNFALTAQAFKDGPYNDINVTSTTLTPSATSGSVTFTASSIVGINGGLGFQQTDVNRAIRFQSQQPAWSGATTYKNNDLVTGSDNNIYQSQVGGNLNHDPTTDNGVNWVVTGQTIVWVWGYITAVADTTHITVAIQPAAVTGRGAGTIVGDTLASTAASTSWQLGLYSQATGWPQGGTYHEGRLWIYGSSITNRIDASCSNDVFNFAPSAPDGTVGDGNAISKQGNGPKINQVFWMFPSERGIIMGCKDAEWLIYASNMEDPLTPTTTQLRRVSTYGCFNVDAVATELTMCFVQREQQRILNYANYPYGEAAGWFADNLSLNADDICAPNIVEIRYQQEPSKFLWARCADGSLIGTTFEHPAYGKEGYNGWHTHSLGGSRTVASISTGPSDNGVTTTLYTIAFNAVTGLYEYLELGHIFDNTQPAWAENFTDGIAEPSVSKERSVANGDPFNGITIYGLSGVIGQTITLNIGGIDVGDFVVAGSDGHIDVPFTATFTRAFFIGLSNGTNYGVSALEVQPADASVYTHFGMGAYNPPLANLTDSAQFMPILYQPKNWFVSFQIDGIRIYNAETLNEITDATVAQITYNGVTSIANSGVACYHPGNNSFYTQYGVLSNSSPIVKIDAATLRQTGLFGVSTSAFLSGPTGFGTVENTIIPLQLNNHNFVCTVFITSAIGHNGIGVIDGDTMSYVNTAQITDAQAYVCPGFPGINQWFGLGTPIYGAASSTAVHTYAFTLAADPLNFIGGGMAIGVTQTGTITPANIDATWTHFSAVNGPAFDPTDGNLLLYFSTQDAVTHQNYWVKVNSQSGAIIWKVAEAAGGGVPFFPINMAQLQMPNGIVRYTRGGTLSTLNTATGAVTTVAFPNTMTTNSSNQLYWPEKNAIIVNATVLFGGAPPGPYDSGTLIPLGTFMTTSNSFGAGWCLLTDAAPASNASWPPPDLYSVPISIGANYTSAGQLLRPDYGQDAGAVAGPAFGKKRRQHWFSAAVVRSQNFNISTDNTFAAANTDAVIVMDQEENVVSQPNLYTGTLSTTMPDGYSWDSQIAWQITRPLPLTITVMGGYIAAQDK